MGVAATNQTSKSRTTLKRLVIIKNQKTVMSRLQSSVYVAAMEGTNEWMTLNRFLGTYTENPTESKKCVTYLFYSIV